MHSIAMPSLAAFFYHLLLNRPSNHVLPVPAFDLAAVTVEIGRSIQMPRFRKFCPVRSLAVQ